ncbi:hypothetical protein [Methylophilus medardicus]|uniref:DUF3300 domain-containing protein n=1 Tax=Methylophilus medardicus TaxID=2588534 RepID=A0A5B8CR05_9PROT|nr:hypothetical protein [Methylophilus medardicus]QDC43629.1 hypothetical protein FIU01_03235 [Methylophilus medardicus]QDC48636.1 hypothetical protein FIU00_03235 [Methylophilus medardicus]QDC52341.1 hypothetical protein FIT99_03235 [Methylophilus medardicus]
MKYGLMCVLWMGVSMSAMAEGGVAVSVGQPGFYGQIVLGNPYPAPQVIYPQPVIIQPPPVAVVQAPLYLRVPPGHMKKWGRYCGQYGACGRQVYFVQDGWYQHVYAPRYNAYAGRPGPGRGGDHHAHWHDDDDHGHGHGRGHGRGHD